MIRTTAVAALLLASLSPGAAQDRPNILLIIADDLGYADLGVHGSDIRTPNIDALADEGLLFTQFHASPYCSTSRAMLFTGNNNHVAGVGRQSLTPGPVIPGLAGYENRLAIERVAVLPQLLRDAGYRTYFAGKWHLGETLDSSPWAAGFERSFAIKFGGGSHFSGVGLRDTSSPKYFRDNAEANWPNGEYSTDFFTNTLIGYLEEDRGDERPFFMVAAYTSPHWPLQVPDEDLDLYAGRYDMGYDRLRELNFERLKAAGVIPSDSDLPPRNPDIAPFASLSAEQQRRETRSMELYAAMIDNLDRHVGRLLDYLRGNDLHDDTLIVFMSDNGAAAETPNVLGGVFHEYVREHYDITAYELMGRKGSFVTYGPQWAEAGSAPFRLRKGFPSQGGLVSPMIMAGPVVERRGEFTDAYMTVMDIMPTLLELARTEYPQDKTPMLGESAAAFLAGEEEAIHDSEYVTVFNHAQRSFLRQGDWKLLSLGQPFDERNFELFNLADDPGETADLSKQNPGKREELLKLWRDHRRRLGIILPQDL